jgi:hypothetical protein
VRCRPAVCSYHELKALLRICKAESLAGRQRFAARAGIRRKPQARGLRPGADVNLRLITGFQNSCPGQTTTSTWGRRGLKVNRLVAYRPLFWLRLRFVRRTPVRDFAGFPSGKSGKGFCAIRQGWNGRPELLYAFIGSPLLGRGGCGKRPDVRHTVMRPGGRWFVPGRARAQCWKGILELKFRA